MVGYDSVVDNNDSNSARGDHGDGDGHRYPGKLSPLLLPPRPRPHLYSTPTVPAALITAFGLPTLVECEQHPKHPPEVVPEETQQQPQFTSVRPQKRRERSLSLPGATTATGWSSSDQQQHYHRLSKSFFDLFGGGGGVSFSDQPSSSSSSISAYTYRVRTVGGGGGGGDHDDHRLRFRQNPDGTYAMDNNNNNNEAHVARGHDDDKDDDDDDDDVPESDTGLLMMASSSSEDDHRKAKKEEEEASVLSLDAVTNLGDALSNNIDGRRLPPHHVHASIPREMLNPQFTETTPALKLWPLAVLVFYNVSGGPFGIEPSIRAGGNFYAILGFAIFPLIWSVPEALITAELGSTFQDPSAGVAWVEEAFGESLGSLCGYLAWVSGATDNAIYPTLFVEYVSSVAGWDQEQFSGITRFGTVAVITIVLAMLNYTGLEIVGNASLVICMIAMSPFVIMTVIGAPKVDPSRWFQMPEPSEDGSELFDDDFQTSAGPLPLFSLGGVLWRPYLNNLFWNLNSFDSAGSFAGETTSASSTYPRGIFIGLIMCVLAYLIPLMVAVGATDYSQRDWVDGHLGSVSVDIGGKWLGVWIIFAAGISNLALFEAEMSSDAFQLMGMAERGYLPKIFQTRSKYGTPTAGIVFNTIVIVIFSCADFGQLLELLNSVYAMSLLMEYAAFVKLRLFHKELERPYRIPIPDWASVLFVIPPILGIFAIIAVSNWYVYFFCTGALVFGVLIFRLSETFKRRGWFTYESKDSRIKRYAMPPLNDDVQSADVSAENEEFVYHDDNGEHLIT